MTCCAITVCVLVALLEWKLGLIRAVLWALRFKLERTTAPTITVPPPNTTFKSSPASVPLKPADAKPAIQCFDKGTNSPIGTVPAVSKDSLQSIVKRAREAQLQWAKSTFAERRKLLFSLTEYVIQHHKSICETSTVECGKTLVDGTLGEILTTLEKLSWTAQYGEQVLAEEVREVGLISIHKRASVSYLPLGVIGAIVSWNYPFHNIIGPMISALFAGNAFVGKVSEWSCFYAKYYESIVRDGLVKLGYSPDLVHFVSGYAETGEALIECVDKVTFIGSPQVGKLVMRKASEDLTPVVLELGGKDPAVVCDDADLEQLIPIVMRGTFQNCGQNCVGLERILLHSKIYDGVVQRLRDLVVNLRQGPPTEGVVDCGAMTMGELSCAKIQALIDDAVSKGARLLAGGRASGGFYPPTLLVDVTSAMAITQEEVFGPVLVVIKFHTDDEAVRIVNDCPYGLGSSVFSADTARAHALGRRLRTGMMNVNDFGINYLCQALPFGGVKVSGFDRFAGIEGLRGNCLIRSETRDRFPGVKTSVPPALQYPLSGKSFDFSHLLVRVLYGNVSQMVGAALSLASFKK